MKVEEVIHQLESLKEHCKEFIDKDDPNYLEDIWYLDTVALDYAINTIKRDQKARQPKKVPKKNILT